MDQRTPSRFRLEQYFRQTIEQTRELLRQSLELLRQPMPDTFLGHKTQEPFPGQDVE
ncbi:MULTISPECIES: hypothetical protein [Bradyrhizobium]|uniref:hypothetical protein n=1 Tax=Bradyrhizobium elkanii TaxID=29448 RepID=UPI0018AD4B4D|nr:hypothetical protein [Bradyrhizobium elkanii]